MKLLSDSLETPQSTEVAGGSVAAVCRPDPIAGKVNEDGVALIELGGDSALLALADGMGGGPAGNLASRAALDALTESVEAAFRSGSSLAHGVFDGFDAASQAVAAVGSQSGTTLAVVLIEGHEIRAFHAGDSEILVVDPRGQLRYRSVPHSPVGYAVEAGMLDVDEALHSDERHWLSNLVGAGPVRFEVSSPLAVSTGDSVLLASDGLVDNLYLREILARVTHREPLAAVEDMALLTSQRMLGEVDGPNKPDDLSVVLWCCP